MKPIELLEDYERICGHSIDEKTYKRYEYEDVVTSYIKNSFGIIFLIKGKIKPFAFSIMKHDLSNEYFGFNLKQIDVKTYFKIKEQSEQEIQEVIFTDEELEKKIKALCLLKELNKG